MQGFSPSVNFGKPDFKRKLLILIALIGVLLFGWLAGHILRYSTLEFWHPPIEEINPGGKIGALVTPLCFHANTDPGVLQELRVLV
jgi:hypothetical protein